MHVHILQIWLPLLACTSLKKKNLTIYQFNMYVFLTFIVCLQNVYRTDTSVLFDWA